MAKLDHGTERAGKRLDPHLKIALRYPHVPTIEDPAFQIMASRKVECRKCGWEDQLRHFGQHHTERAGRSIVTCQCPDCGTRWKRIEV